MKVELMQGTQDAIKLLSTIGSICYGHEEAKNPEAMMRNLNKLEHHSVFEHAFYTFKIEGISRACLAQLTRHRHASYTVRSQRYCDESETEFVFPDSKEIDSVATTAFAASFSITMDYYKSLLNMGVKREDARAILPQATSTDLYMTLNLRELLHINSLRVDPTAQDEINELVKRMVQEVLINDIELMFLFQKEEI